MEFFFVAAAILCDQICNTGTIIASKSLQLFGIGMRTRNIMMFWQVLSGTNDMFSQEEGSGASARRVTYIQDFTFSDLLFPI